MKCPNCGAEVGSTPFCPQCGADTSSAVRERRRFLRSIDRRVRQISAAAVVFVAVMSVLLVVLSAVPTEVVDPHPSSGPPEGSFVIDDRTYIVTSDGFSSQGFSLGLDGEARVTVSLSDPSLSGDSYYWEVRCDTDSTSYSITKDTPVLTWIERPTGTWTVTVHFEGDDGTEVRTGSFTYYSDSIQRYVWEHLGKTLSVSYTVLLEDYLSACSDVPGRGTDSLQAASRFVDAAQVSDLEGRIRAAYSSAFGGVPKSADYAACLMEFVSSCFEEREDYVVHGASVYWAYPVQTLYSGSGDSGDLAVLAASLLGSAGIDAGLARLPGLWAVAMDVYGPSTIVDPGVTALSVDIGGTRFWVTSVSQYKGIGLVPDCYGYDGGFTYYGVPAGPGYDVLLCRENRLNIESQSVIHGVRHFLLRRGVQVGRPRQDGPGHGQGEDRGPGGPRVRRMRPQGREEG